MVQNAWKPYQDEIQALQSNDRKKKVPKGQKKKRSYPERDMQLQLVSWFRMVYPRYARYLIHYPAERKCSSFQGLMLRRLGCIAGFSDLMLLVPTAKSPGLFLELKASGKKPTELQHQFLDDMSGIGYTSGWADSFDEAKRIIEDYLNGW